MYEQPIRELQISLSRVFVLLGFRLGLPNIALAIMAYSFGAIFSKFSFMLMVHYLLVSLRKKIIFLNLKMSFTIMQPARPRFCAAGPDRPCSSFLDESMSDNCR